MDKFDVIVETPEGLHIMLAEVSNRQHGAIVAEAIYYQFKDAPAGGMQVRYVWLRDMSDPRTPHLLDAWPERWKDYDGWLASVAAWKKSPRGVSGDESEPDGETTKQAVQAELARLPECYAPVRFEHTSNGYLLQINHTTIFQGKPAREAIERTRRYVAEHEHAGWKLPTGVIDGMYD